MATVPVVSVIIPCYNKIFYIDRCIESILRQSLKDFEIVVVDDCSFDGSFEHICKKYMHIENINIYQNKINRGVSFTRNKGIELSKANFVTCIDADDMYINNEKLEFEYKVLIDSTKNTISYSSYYLINDEDNIIKENEIKNISKSDICLRRKIVPRDFMYNKKLFTKVGGYSANRSLYEDWEYIIKLIQFAEIKYSGCYGTGYRRDTSGLSSVSNYSHYLAMIDVFKKNCQVKLSQKVSFYFMRTSIFVLKAILYSLPNSKLIIKKIREMSVNS